MVLIYLQYVHKPWIQNVATFHVFLKMKGLYFMAQISSLVDPNCYMYVNNIDEYVGV